MKTVILAFLIFSTSARSGVTDVEFMPETGDLYLKSTFSMNKQKRKETSPFLQNQVEEREQESMTLENSLTYSFYKNFELGIEWDISISDETVITSQTQNGVAQTSGNSTTNFFDDSIDNPGIQDPFLKGRFRMPLPGDLGFNLDLFGAISPSIGGAERGDSDDNPRANLEGNAFWGGHRARIGMGINHDNDQFQWSINVIAQINFEREIKQYDATTSPLPSHAVYIIDTYQDFTLETKILFELTDRVHLLSSLAIKVNGSQDSTNQTTSSLTSQTESSSDIELGLEAYWNFTDMLSARIGFKYSSLGEYDVDEFNVSTLTSSTKYSDLSKTSIQTGVNFSF